MKFALLDKKINLGILFIDIIHATEPFHRQLIVT